MDVLECYRNYSASVSVGGGRSTINIMDIRLLFTTDYETKGFILPETKAYVMKILKKIKNKILQQ